MAHPIVRTLELPRAELNKTYWILFTEMLSHKKACEHFGFDEPTTVNIIWRRSGFYIIETEKMTGDNYTFMAISFRNARMIFPEHFCDAETIEEELDPLSDMYMSCAPEPQSVEMDGQDANHYPSIMMAIGLV